MNREHYYKPEKIKTDKVLFWGCFHFDHNKEFLYKNRGFNSVEEHNDTLVRSWNEKVEEMNGEVVGVLLGDTMFGHGGLDKFEHLLGSLNYTHLYLCSGNHSAGFKQAIKDSNFEQNHAVTFMPNYFELIVKRQPIACSHYPILSWNGQGAGTWHLYSHVHGSLWNSDLGRAYKESGAKQYECSVEENPYPISFQQLKDIMSKRESVSFDHHGPNTNNPF